MKFCVIGIGKFGYQAAVTLAENNIEVLAIDQEETKIEHIRDKVTQAACIKIIDADSLYRIGIEEMDGAIIALTGNFTETAILTRILKNDFHLNTVIACTNNKTKGDILDLLGADQIVKPEVEAATRLADGLSSPFPQMTRITENLTVIQIAAPSKFVGKKLNDVLLYENHRVICIAIKRDEDVMLANPEAEIEENDNLFITGLRADLEELEKEV